MNRTVAAHRPAHRRAHRSFLSWVDGMLALHRQRRALSRLDDHLLEDIGISRPVAEAEAFRAPWESPAHWLR